MSEIERAIDDFNNYVEMGYGQYFRPSSESTELALTALKEKLEREKNPLTWNERINQMTAEEKAPYFVYEDTLIDWEDDYNGESTSTETPIYRSSLASDMFFYVEQDAIAATVKILHSPYTEGETK